ncbi:MAG: tetratricopeptide repeat protein [Planctomycetota bacterium]|jgi:tetratricopeptide (TPR) repeat protein
MRVITLLASSVLFAACLPAAPARGASTDAEWARENIKAGRYADAVKSLEKAVADAKDGEKAGLRLELARLYLLVGRYDDVPKLFEKTEKPGVDELVLAGRAHMARGRYEKAEEALGRAFRDSKLASAAARTELIDLWTLTGRRDEAELSRTWFFQNYKKISKIRYGRLNREKKETEEVKDAGEMVALARAMAPRDPQGAINAYTRAEQLNAEKKVAEAEPYVRSFFLFMDRFSWNEATAELRRAVKVSKTHPEVQLCVAYYQWSRKKNAEAAEKALKSALEINPNLIPARVMMAHLHLFDDEHEEARKELDAALKVNPKDLDALSSLAAWYYDNGEKEKFEETCAQVLKLNPHYADLYNTIAGACERKRQFPQAHKFYLKAIEIDPEHWRGYYGAGMALARRGEDAAGKKLLEKSFKLNKYNLFCRNMLVVLDKLVPPEGYKSQFDSVKTDHFLIFAPKKDAAFLLPYYARCLEEAYARFREKYKFTPENPTVVEVFSDHGQFSARTTGLPLIGADGACFGKLITLDSPRVWQAGTVGKFNWATVAEHELMHVFSLQITDYRIPRWLTEGLSVFEEEVPRIELDALFASAVRNSRLIKVKDLNRQMTRPTARMNPLLAYYQARRIVEHVYAKHGTAGMEKLLAQCRSGKKIEEAIPAALGSSMEEFEKEVLEHQKKFAAEVVRYSGAPDKATFTKLQLEVKESPDDPAKAAALASAFLQGKKPNYEAAAKYARQAISKGETGPGVARGHAVLGFIAFRRDKKYRRARAYFEKALAADPENVAAHLYLGVCLGKEGVSEKAAEHLIKAKRMSRRNIGEVNAYEELYKVYRDMEKEEEALAVMRERVAVDKKGFDKAIRLAKLAIGRKNYQLAAWAAYQAVKVDPFRVEAHLVWGEAAEKLGDLATAEREWRLAVLADAASADAKIGWARTLLAKGNKPGAKWAALEARALEPDRPDIKSLLEAIGPVDPKKPDEAERPPSEEELKLIKGLTGEPGEATKGLDELLEKPKKPDEPEKKPEEKPKTPADPGKETPLKELEKVDACAPPRRLVA